MLRVIVEVFESEYAIYYGAVYNYLKLFLFSYILVVNNDDFNRVQ